MHDIDPELMYCPTCNDEYRSDMTLCAVCEVDLISGDQRLAQEQALNDTLASRTMEISPDDDLVPLRKGVLLEMKNLQNILAKERIPALITSDESSCGKSCGKGCGGTELNLLIRREDAQAAIDILARDFREKTSLDDHDLTHVSKVYDRGAAQAVCPACGCSFTTSNPTCPDCGLCF
ncbi:MAG: hypothetical protein H8E79_04965 [Desulfobulbaceae bacterium]|uniref:Uncharacterized protein n=1 Tax=Candidatus Desulfatifera sulfidica TaxID=2841691 RepID=A0A8J6N845_9BACT|nr:hypothetical protein [Candidatus Desulfatifera sulfidica]